MFRTFDNNGRFGIVHEGCVESDTGIPIQRFGLHCPKRLSKIGAAIGVYEVVATVHSRGDCVRLFGSRHPKGNGQHNGIAIGHDSNFHCFFGIMSVPHINIVGQRRT